ncbi:MAG: hypothetical protein ACRDPG_03770 [Nocardioidaceae bacterium]
MARIHRAVAPGVAFLCSCLALSCLGNAVDVSRQLTGLRLLDDHLIGWIGASLAIAVGVGALCLATSHRVGAGPAVALGAAGAVFGLALGSTLRSDADLVLALLILPVGVGALVAGGIAITCELPWRWSLVALFGWAVPLAVGWPIRVYFSLHAGPRATPGLVLHPQVTILAAVVVVLVMWSALTMLLEPVHAREHLALRWEGAWAVLAGVLAGVASVVMLVGFTPDLPTAWLRPVVLLASAATIAGLVLTSRQVPSASARVGFAAVATVCLTVPSGISLLLQVADGGRHRLTWPVVVLAGLAGLLGVYAGWLWPRVGCWAGLLVVAASCAGGWVMPAQPWVMLAAAAPLTLGGAAALVAGVRSAFVSLTAARFLALGVLGTLLIGLVGVAALAWALTGDLPSGPADAQVVGRVVLGVTFALAVLVGAYIWTATDETRRVRPQVAAAERR